MASNEKVYRVSCSCGCGDGFEFRYSDGELSVGFFRDDWYAEQKPGRTGLVDRLRYIRGERGVRDVMLSREDLVAIREFLAGCGPVACPDGDRYSDLRFEEFDEDMYGAFLTGRMPGAGVLFGWYHRLFAIEACSCDVSMWINQIDRILAG